MLTSIFKIEISFVNFRMEIPRNLPPPCYYEALISSLSNMASTYIDTINPKEYEHSFPVIFANAISRP